MKHKILSALFAFPAFFALKMWRKGWLGLLLMICSFSSGVAQERLLEIKPDWQALMAQSVPSFPETQGYVELGQWKAFGIRDGLDAPGLFDILLLDDWLYVAGLSLSYDGDQSFGLVRIHTKTQQVEILAERLQFGPVTGWIQELLPYRGGVVAIGAFTDLDGRYARSIAYWKDGQWQMIPSRVEGTILSGAIVEDTLYSDGIAVAEPDGRVYQYIRAYNLATMERLPAIGKLGRDKGIPMATKYVAVGKTVWVFGFFDRVLSGSDTVEARNAAVYDLERRQWEPVTVPLDSFPTVGLQTFVMEDTLLYVYGEQLGRQRHLYRIAVPDRSVEELPLPRHSLVRTFFQHHGRLYAVFTQHSPADTASWWMWIGRLTDDDQWEPVAFPCLSHNGIRRIISDQRQWWYAAGWFVMPDGGKALMRVDFRTLDWENLGQEIINGFDQWIFLPVVRAMAQDPEYVYVAGQYFRKAGPVPTGVVARWNKRWQRWEPLYDGCAHLLNGQGAYTIAVDSTAVYVGGKLLAIYGQGYDGRYGVLFRFLKQQRRWERLGGIDEAAMPAVRRIALWRQKVYAVGPLEEDTVKGKFTRIRVYDLEQHRWQDFAGLSAVDGNFRCFALLKDTAGVYFGGEFRIPLPSGDTLRNFALWDGEQWQRVGNPGDWIDGRVSVIARAAAGIAIFGKLAVHRADGTVIHNAALWDGEQWQRVPLVTDAVETRTNVLLDYAVELPDYGWWVFGGSHIVEVAWQEGTGRLGMVEKARFENMLPPFLPGTIYTALRVGNEVWIGGEFRYVLVPDQYLGISYGVVRWQPPSLSHTPEFADRTADVQWRLIDRRLHLELTQTGAVTITLYDLQGRQLAMHRGRGRSFTLPPLLSPGVYVCRVQWQSGQVVALPVAVVP